MIQETLPPARYASRFIPVSFAIKEAYEEPYLARIISTRLSLPDLVKPTHYNWSASSPIEFAGVIRIDG